MAKFITLKRNAKTGRFLSKSTKRGFHRERYEITKRPGEPPLLLPVSPKFHLEKAKVPRSVKTRFEGTNFAKIYLDVPKKAPPKKQFQFYLFIDREFDRQPVSEPEGEAPKKLSKKLRRLYPVPRNLTLKQFKRDFDKWSKKAVKQIKGDDEREFGAEAKKYKLAFATRSSSPPVGSPEARKLIKEKTLALMHPKKRKK